MQVREETFVTETDAAANDFKDPVSGKDLKKMEEPSYFFKLSEYQERLIAHIKANPEFVVPESRCAHRLAHVHLFTRWWPQPQCPAAPRSR